MPFTIQQIRQAPQGFKDNVLALVTFTYDADEMNPVLTAKRSAKVRDEWREYATAKIRLAPGSKVQIIDAQLMRGDRGTWLAVRDFDVPRELLAEVAAVAAERARAASDADNEDPFEQGQQARAGMHAPPPSPPSGLAPHQMPTTKTPSSKASRPAPSSSRA